MTLIRRIHFYFGLAVVVHFIITGLELRLNVFGIESSDVSTRMMFRASHIYILFSGLLNLLLSFTLRSEDKLNAWQVISSFIMLVATTAISISFYLEPVNHTFPRKITGYSLQLCLLGTVLQLFLLQFYYKNRR